MSRNLIPAVLAIGVGVFTGYYTFQPSFQDLAIERAHGNPPAPDSSSSSPVKNATLSSDQQSNAAKSGQVPENAK